MVTSRAKPFSPPNGSIDNEAVEEGAAIEATKLRHQHQRGFAQDHGVAANAQRKVIHVCEGATGEVISVDVGAVVKATGDSTITVDLYKNGASILTSTIQVDENHANYALVAGAINDAALAQDDVLEVVLTVNAGTGTLPQGAFVSVVIREDAQ